MSKKTSLYPLIIDSLLYRHNLKADTSEIHVFLEKQINKMPDFMRFIVSVIYALFYFFINLITFGKFNYLNISKRTKIIFFYRNFPLFKIFFRLVETIVLLKAIEEKQ